MYLKYFFCITLVLITFAFNLRQDSYSITGDIKNIPDGFKIALYEEGETTSPLETKTIKNGHFEFSNSLKKSPLKLALVLLDKNSKKTSATTCKIWAGTSPVVVSGEGVKAAEWFVRGDVKEQSVLNEIQQIKAVTENSEKKDSLIFEVIKQHPVYSGTLNELSSIAYRAFRSKSESVSKKEIISLFNRLEVDSAYQQSREYKRLAVDVKYGLNYVSKGKKMVNVTAYDVDNKKYELEQLKGKYILLDFWYAHCSPCKRAFPKIKKFQEENKDLVTVVGINTMTREKDLEDWKKVSKEYAISWLNLTDDKRNPVPINLIYNVPAYPTYILIGPDGIVLDNWMGGNEKTFTAKIREHIKGVKLD
ncbi:TlpA disulfide reductase family protein [Pedobacter endophyticus]|uniref:AhpC/TSA family protein n=1 Tax=Pedobacter endophyticus TaxID=2789740 RepID=A0A7S9KZK3_9SPHI|nr:TlpA disulfide reductase family protein [Pedobacter endophyticus]QPH39720.1 AhpC/TSA family protein [Pedobacter endophyticus]